MKKLSRFTLLFVMLFGASMFLMNCEKKVTDSNPEEPEETATLTQDEVQEAAQPTYYSTLYSEALAMPASALAAATTGSSALMKTGATLDTILTGCPVATFDRSKRELLLDYGEGCQGTAGVTHSGSILLTGSMEPGNYVFTTTFNNYTINNYMLSGEVKFKVNSINEIEMDLNDCILSKNDTVYYLGGLLKLILDTNGTPQDLLDDTFNLYFDFMYYKVFNGETMVHQTLVGTNYQKPLKYRLGCPYPFSGTVVVHRPAKPYFLIDYEPLTGGCDDIVKIYKEGWDEGVIVPLGTLF